jgi:Niemann-Pick C1 protein
VKIYIPISGATWENDQELRAHPGGMPDDDIEDSGYFERLGAKTERFLEKFFTAWGTYCASHPWLILFIGKFEFCQLIFFELNDV